MSQHLIFVSCGQHTEEEKELGKAIARMVKAITNLEPFFAEEVHDLNGLDDNILNALRKCAGFVTVLHPRGSIERPNGKTITRASVWIEQEIAIATYIQRVEKRPLEIIAFKHVSVGREGLRDLIHLNPIEFSNNIEVLTELANRLQSWKSLTPSGIRLELDMLPHAPQDGHLIRTLRVTVVNDTARELKEYSMKIDIPKRLLQHWSASYGGAEAISSDPSIKSLRYNQQSYRAIAPRSGKPTFTTDICLHCGGTDITSAIVTNELPVTATMWADDNEYPIRKTVKELAIEASKKKSLRLSYD